MWQLLGIFSVGMKYVSWRLGLPVVMVNPTG